MVCFGQPRFLYPWKWAAMRSEWNILKSVVAEWTKPIYPSFPRPGALSEPVAANGCFDDDNGFRPMGPMENSFFRQVKMNDLTLKHCLSIFLSEFRMLAIGLAIWRVLIHSSRGNTPSSEKHNFMMSKKTTTARFKFKISRAQRRFDLIDLSEMSRDWYLILLRILKIHLFWNKKISPSSRT